jgi:hypothetical protein
VIQALIEVVDAIVGACGVWAPVESPVPQRPGAEALTTAITPPSLGAVGK